MTIKTIITEPNKILRQVSKPVLAVSSEERKLMDDFPSYQAIIESLENGVLIKTSAKKSSAKRGYIPHHSIRQMN